MLCMTWGFNQVATKLAMADVPPLIQCTIRSILATLIVAGWARLRGVPLTLRDGTLIPGLICGALFGLEFLLIYRGLLFTTASRAVLFIYLAPFFVVIGARWLLPSDRFGLMQWAGLLLSFLGMVIAFGLPTPAADPRQLVGDIMMVAAAAAWAATTLLIKASSLNRISSERTLLYQLVVSIPILGLGALAFGERMTASAGVAGARVADLSDPGRQLHLCDLVRADRALFGEPAVGLHVPDAAVRRRRRPPDPGRADDAGLCGRGRAGCGRPGARQPAVTVAAILLLSP